MRGHRFTISKKASTILANHFNSDCKYADLAVFPIEQTPIDDDMNVRKLNRKAREKFWIRELWTAYPYGLNDRMNYDWSRPSKTDTSGRVEWSFNHEKRNFRKRSSKRSNKKAALPDFEQFCKDMNERFEADRPSIWKVLRTYVRQSSIKLVTHLSSFLDTHDVLDRLLQIPLLELIRARLEKPAPVVTKKRPDLLLKLTYWNKRMDIINLPRILNIAEVKTTIDAPIYPSVVYKSTKPVTNKVLNHHIDSPHDFRTPFTCDCQNSSFCDPTHHHVLTGNLNVIADHNVRTLLLKGPKFRRQMNMNWDTLLKHLTESIDDCILEWSKKTHKTVELFQSWKTAVLKHVLLRKDAAMNYRIPKIDHTLQQKLDDIHEKYVLVPADKAANNIIVVCKQYYGAVLTKEVQQGNTYEQATQPTEAILDQHIDFATKHELTISNENRRLPSMYWLPKMHKSPPKPRFIAASFQCSTKPCSQRLSLFLKAILDNQRVYCRSLVNYLGTNRMWIIDNNEHVRTIINRLNKTNAMYSVDTFDFTTLYTSIPHLELKVQLAKVVTNAFKGKHFLTAYKTKANWTKKRSRLHRSINATELIEEINFLVDNIYVFCGNQLYRQTIGIPMGTDCAPFLANLFLYSYESEWMKNLKPVFKGRHFNHTLRFIDDVLVVNAGSKFLKHSPEIYPASLKLEQTNSSSDECNYLDLHISVRNNLGTTRIYNKTDDFPFEVIRYPHASTNAPSASCYGIAIGQWLRYLNACMEKNDFINRSKELVQNFLKRGYKRDRLLRTWEKFLTRHNACAIYQTLKKTLTKEVFP